MKIPKFLLKKEAIHIQILSLLSIILKIPIFFEPHWHSDEGFFSAVCIALENNLVLYKDVWSNRFPGIYGIYCLSNIFPNTNYLVLKATLVIAAIFSIFFIYKIVAKKTNSNTAIIVSIISALLLNLPILYTNIVVEATFTLVFILSAIFFITNKDKFILAGVSIGIASFFSIQAFIFSVTFIIFLIFYLKKTKNILRFLAGFSTPIILILIYLFKLNALNSFLSQSVFPYIRELNNQGGLGFLFFPNNLITRSILFVISAIFLIIYYKTQKIKRNVFLFAVLALNTAYSILFTGQAYTHYLILLIPIFSTLLVIFVKKDRIKDLGIFILSTFCFLNLFSGGNKISFLNPISYYSKFVSYITKESDTVTYANSFNNNAYSHYYLNSYLSQTRNNYSNTYIWTDNPWIYKLSNIDNPPVKYLLSYKAVENFNQVKNTLKNNKPFLIIVDENSTSPLTLEEFILENGYLLNKTLENYKIYALEE